MTADRHGVAVVDAFGEPAARELLDAITRSDARQPARGGNVAILSDKHPAFIYTFGLSHAYMQRWRRSHVR